MGATGDGEAPELPTTGVDAHPATTTSRAQARPWAVLIIQRPSYAPLRRSQHDESIVSGESTLSDDYAVWLGGATGPSQPTSTRSWTSGSSIAPVVVPREAAIYHALEEPHGHLAAARVGGARFEDRLQLTVVTRLVAPQ